MTRLQRILALVLSLGTAPALSACGGSGSGGGNTQSPALGTITLVSFAPNPILGCDPVPYTITGNDFETVTGTTARITWRALGGQTPFAHGTTDHVTTFANVTSNTTIDGISPNALLCGVPSVTVEIDVTLESGVTASSTGIFSIVINAPTIVSIAPNPLPAAIATPFIITGTGFPGSLGPVTIRFTGDNGALLFNDGTHNYVDVQGLVTSTTTIAATSPIATVCGINAVTLAQLGASIQLFFPDGCCTLPTVPGFVNFLAPQILSLVPNSIPAELPPANLVLSGLQFGPPNTIATVRFIADANVALFNDGTLNTIDVPGLIGPTTFPNLQTITLISPTAAVCGVASRTAAIRVISPYGSSCRESGPAFVTFTAPVITTVNNVAQASVPGHIPTQILIQGTGFGPANGICAVTFISDPVAPAIFGDGTQIESAPVQGVINAAGTQITVTTPHATVQGAAQRFASLRIRFQGDSCANSGAQVIQFTAATLAAMTATAPTAGTFFAAVPTSFSLTGANFGPVGSEAFVRFTADNGATPFGNGTQNSFEVPGTVTGVGTITGVAPLAALCPQTTLGATVRAIFQDGGQSANTVAMTFTAPTIAFSPASFGGASPVTFTITGTGFGPANSLAAVKFTATGIATPFADGTLNEVTVTGTVNGAATQVTGLTPLVAICGVASITATVSATFQGGACASTAAGAVTITAPTLPAGAFAPSSVPAEVSTPFTITGTGFGTNGDLAQVTFSVTPPATPFSAGSASSATVTGTVGGLGTTISGFTPIVSACVNTLADVRVTLQNGACSNLLTGAVTFTVPQTFVIAPTNAAGLGTNPATPIVITGANFPVLGTPVQVTFVVAGGLPTTPFAGGTLAQVIVNSTVGGGSSISLTQPLACATANVVTDVFVSFGSVPCRFAAGTFTFNAPTITTITPVTSLASLAPAQITINGTNLQPNAIVSVLFTAASGTPFNDGTSSTASVPATVNGTGTAIGPFTPPTATLCGVASVVATPTVSFPAATCSIVSPVTVTYNATTITAFATSGTGGGANIARQTLQNPYTITGTGYFPVIAPVLVRFARTAGATTPFQGGTSDTVDVASVITSATTIGGTTPLATATTSFTATVQAFFEDGSCSNVFGPITFNAPPVVTDVSTNLLVREFGAAPANRSFLTNTETSMTITGANFTAGAVALVYKQANGPGGPVGTGALTAPTLTVPTTIVGGSPIDGTIPVDAQAEVRVTNLDGQSGTFTSPGFVFRVRGHVQNTNVSLQGGLNSEMEAAVDPTNPRNLATLSHGTNAPGDVRLAFSTDAGRTWTQTNIGNAQDGLSAAQDRIDPRCAYDRFGNLYLCYFTRGPAPARTMIVLQSFDKGVTFPVANRQTVVASNATDKEFLVTGPNGANAAQEAIYVGWDDGTTSGIIVSGATCTGAGVAQSAYSAPVQIIDTPVGTTTQFSNACVGPNGDLHVVWINLTAEPAGGEGPVLVQYDRDPLGLFAGAGFGTNITVATTNFGSFDGIPATPLRQTYCMPEVSAVLTGSSAGRVCITYGVENPDESNDADIVCRFTDNGGISFSPEIPVNDDGTATAQWQASVRADRATGTLVSAWYDSRRDIVNNRLLDIYASMSFDGGMTWQSNMRITDGQSDQATLANGNEFLDYQGLSIHNGMALVTWADNSNSTGDNPNGVTQTENYASRFQFR